MEVDQWLNGNLCLNIALLLCLLQLLNLRVVGCHVGVVVLGVVQLHDLARDGWLECAIVVCYNISSDPSSPLLCYCLSCGGMVWSLSYRTGLAMSLCRV